MSSYEIHHLKLNECFAEAVYKGEKNFEIRRIDDRCFQKGDRIIFTVVDNCGQSMSHALNHAVFEITYILPYYGLKEKFVALAIKRRQIK